MVPFQMCGAYLKAPMAQARDNARHKHSGERLPSATSSVPAVVLRMALSLPHTFQRLSLKITLRGNCCLLSFSCIKLLRTLAPRGLWQRAGCVRGRWIWGNSASSLWEENSSAQQSQAFSDAFLCSEGKLLSSLAIPRAAVPLGSPGLFVV